MLTTPGPTGLYDPRFEHDACGVSFVANMNTDENDAVIVRSTVDLGRNLGLRVVAEGVETEAVSALLLEIGCELAQGYYFAGPMPANEVTAWFRQHIVATATA